ncbi:MAG: nicotinic acid mononucleotide adenylyltransferase [Hydrogenophilales bacterium 16-64-46]|nr:MAG: nicotinic acid mononucleotide adenylyltransferase [Hydrogenophilales bacterium 12-64-13]OYZ05360.1 MAG: nicotinic acid mononucleotide adenylyltransferase [Hydrogenophilales bacterium 16-64-46]OZA37714.1 MAG: nicotinic acid mononucleotide adenylyltransferase [Hydrogenophilales bacterium 17-64-34]HQS99339.1 nicotinate-nucleotide adenylyltransferase [Thiobacillus sp.]
MRRRAFHRPVTPEVEISTTRVTGAIGLYGGTFDPIHLAHLRLAEELADALELAQVRFVPSGVPPHRAAPVASAPHRLAMTRFAVAGNPRFVVDAREVERAGPSYMVDTLASLRSELGDSQPLWLLLGADSFLGLPGWHDWTRLFALAHIAVAERPGASLLQSDALPDALRAEIAARRVADGSAAGPAGTVLLRHMTPLDISATAIREALARGHSARYLLPDSVLDYIQENQLYA